MKDREKSVAAQTSSEIEAQKPWHALETDRVLAALDSNERGLTATQAADRIQLVGPNLLPRPKQPGLLAVYLRQFKNPLVYLLVLATLVSLGIGEMADALFIFVVLQFNAAIGTFQEWKAQSSAAALDALIKETAVVRRDGLWTLLDASQLVPGDIVRLESGARIAADLRLIRGQELLSDQSLLTGESVPVSKISEAEFPEDQVPAERSNILFAGTTLLSGRALGVVVATGHRTQVGRIAQALIERPGEAPPLIYRLERFSRLIGIATLVIIAALAGVQLAQGLPLATVFLIAVALAVAAIPEGLPIAITVALAVAVNRMQRRNVIVRALPAVEGLGACTLIATDKTGTLTHNELTVNRLLLFSSEGQGTSVSVSGAGYSLDGGVSRNGEPLSVVEEEALLRLVETAALCNEASLRPTADGVTHLGDTVDVAFLVLAQKLDIDTEALRQRHQSLAEIPYEPQRRFAATFTALPGVSDQALAHVKGAAEFILPRCSGIDRDKAMQAVEELAAEGYRVLALARGRITTDAIEEDRENALKALDLLGIAGLIDPLREEVPEAIATCRAAGISVRMITGDHPKTALAIARSLDLAQTSDEVVTGEDLSAAEPDPDQFDLKVRQALIFARVQPIQKLAIVESLQRSGEVVAVTGDGVNDAPALSAAAIGVAMGRCGTDVARGASDLILADDNFASIVGGVEEGRIAYDNVRKLVFLLIATGLGEIVLFLLSILAGLPVPLFAVQLLWLNLVTNGIQDVALAFEKGEPGILRRTPRPPTQSLFDRRMTLQVFVAGIYMGGIAFAFFDWCLDQGMGEHQARNLVLLLMVMFENAQAINARSETRSVFRVPLSANWFLITAIAGAHGLHIAAMYTPGAADVLDIAGISLHEWAMVGALAASLVLVMEIFKRVAPKPNNAV